jgi:hypothetical protein
MAATEHPEVLLSYSLPVGGREFLIRVMTSGWIVWDDYQARRDCCGPAAPMAADDRFTVSMKMEPRLTAWFQEVAGMLANGSWSTKHEADLDARLAPVFWNEVNPRLLNPLPAPMP